MRFLCHGWFSGEGGAEEGGSDGAAREGGKRNTTYLMLIESCPQIVPFRGIDESMRSSGIKQHDNQQQYFDKCPHSLEMILSMESHRVAIPELNRLLATAYQCRIQIQGCAFMRWVGVHFCLSWRWILLAADEHFRNSIACLFV